MSLPELDNLVRIGQLKAEPRNGRKQQHQFRRRLPRHTERPQMKQHLCHASPAESSLQIDFPFVYSMGQLK